MAKYKIVKLPKYPGGGEVELQGMRYRKDDTGKFFYLSGAPITDPLLIQKLTYEAKPVGLSPAVAPSPYANPDIRTGAMKVQAAQHGPPTTKNATALKTANEQKKKEDAAIALQKKLDAEAKLKLEEEQAFALANPNAALSETLPGVAAKVTPQTEDQWKNFEGAKQEYYDKRNFLAGITLEENYDNIVYEVARDIQKNNPKLSFEEALAKAKGDEEALKKKAINTYVTQDPDVLDRVATERGFYSPQKAGNIFIKSFNPNDGTHVSFADPGTIEGYLTQAKDVILNPLDATHYFMTNEEMPFNYGAYEEMKQRNGYEDASDKNVILNALDQASWFHPAGLYGQGMKMIEPTAESIQNVVEDPTLDNFGTAAWDLGMTALTFAGAKSPLKYIAEESQAIKDAHFISDFMRNKAKGPNPANSGTGLLPIASIEAAPSVLPSVPVTDINLAAMSNVASPSKFSAAENKIIANKIDDAIQNKLELWQTPEGINRLQQMIDTTPALAGETPHSFLEGLSDMLNYNAVYDEVLAGQQALEDNLNQLEILHNEGKLSSADYKEQIKPLEKELIRYNEALANGEENLNKYSGQYNVSSNTIAIRPGSFKPEEISKVAAHELGHFPGGYATKNLAPTSLDNELADLDLISDTSTQLTIPGFIEQSGNSGYSTLGMDDPNYLNESLRYFKEGSKGTEKVPYLSEVRQDMLEKGIIQSEYDKITPKMLKEHFKNYKNTQGEKYPLRLYDIMKDKPENFNRLSKVLDKLPMIMQAAGLADAFFGDEDVNTKEAGFSLMLGALSKGKGKALKFGKSLKKFTGNLKSAVLFEDKALNKLHKLKLKEAGRNFSEWNDFHINEYTPKNEILQTEIERYKTKIKNLSVDPKLDPLKLHQTEQKLNELETQLESLVKHDNELRIKTNSPLGYVTDVGNKPIISFKTGKPVEASVVLPGKSISYSIDKNKLNKTQIDSSNPIVSKEYINVLKDNINYIESTTGAKVFGSAVGVTEGGLPHLTGDIDALILDTDYKKNVKNKLKRVGKNGSSQTHNIGINNEQGNIDFNIIHTNSDGTVKINWIANPAGGPAKSLELELLRQFFPDEFYALQKEVIKKSNKNIEEYLPSGIFGRSLNKTQTEIDPVKLGYKINIPAKEFIEKIDPAVKTIVDAYESSKVKHMNRIDSYINYGNTDLVQKGQETYVKSLVGSKGNLGPQLSNAALSDVEQNKIALKKMEFIGDIDHVAKDPKRMQLVLNDYYINNSITNRMVDKQASLKSIEDSFKKWDPSQGGGSGGGWGLNTVLLGDPSHYRGNIMGQMQYKIKVDSSSPVAYVDSIQHATGNKIFSPEEKNEIYNILTKHGGIKYSTQAIKNIKETWHLLHLPTEGIKQKDIQKIFNDITKQLEIRATGQPGGVYGNSAYRSILGDFDDATDTLQYAILSTALKPKSLVQRKNVYRHNGIDLDKNFDESLLQSVEDYKKLENLVNGGLKKAQERQQANIEFITHINNELNIKAETYAQNKNPELAKEISEMKKKLEIYEKKDKDLRQETHELATRALKISEFRKSILPLILGAVTVVPASMLMYNQWTKPEETGFNSMFNADELSSKEKKYVDKYYNKHKSLKGFTWPNGDPAEIHQTQGEKLLLRRAHIKPPKTRMKKGGEIELDLTPEEIQDYIQKGYVVEQQ